MPRSARLARRAPRHAARRDTARLRAVLLPAVLLVAGGSALTGMAVLPAAADDRSRTPVVAAAAPAEAAAHDDRANVALLQVLRRGAEADRAARELAATRERARASRARRAAPEFVRPGVGPLTSGYGARWGRLHAGIDLASGTGSPVVAVAAGTVQSAGEEGGYGLCVRVLHGNGTVSVYAHLSALLVEAGQPVRAGTPLGREGSSGHSTGPHLHFELRVGDRPIDPLPWLRERGVVVEPAP